jgi:hypothetical protein
MKREDKILKLINKTGYGVEVGPSYNPIAPKRAGYQVQVIDRMNREELVAHYQGHNQPSVRALTLQGVRFLPHDGL